MDENKVTTRASPGKSPSKRPALTIQLEDIHKSFGGATVLRGLDLEVLERETMVIIGRSGTGKSVTLKHIVGLISADTGRVQIFGQDLAGISHKKLLGLRLRIGYLFQSGALLNWMSIEDNVALPLLEHLQIPRSEVRDRVRETLKLVDLADAGSKFPAEVSGGMKKRAGLARAVILQPEVILYDEPTSGLDPVMASTINDLVIHTREVLGVTQVVVTHDMESAYRIADRIAMLYEGKIIALGTPEEIRGSKDPVVQQFITGSATGPITGD